MSYLLANVRGDIMWRTEAGERVLTEAEWAVFVHGLEQFLDDTDPDQPDEPVSQDSDVAVNRATSSGTLTLGQRLVLLAEVAPALRDPLVPLPQPTLSHEIAIHEVMREYFDALELEVCLDSTGVTVFRQGLLAAAGAAGNAEGRPEATEKNVVVWFRLFDRMLERLAWHDGIDIPDDWLALPPEVAMERMRLAGYDGKAYYARPKEPTEEQVVTARKTLERLVLMHHLPETDWSSPAEMNLLAQVKWQHETQSTRNGDVESWVVEKDEFFAAIFMGLGCAEGEPGRPYFWVIVPPEADGIRGRVAEGLASSLLVAKKQAMDALIRFAEQAQSPSSSK